MTVQRWEEEFSTRLKFFDAELRALYLELYHRQSDYDAFREMLYRAWSERNGELRELDRQRLSDPDWYKKRGMLGMQMYVGAFAGNLDGVREKLNYIQDCGVNYLISTLSVTFS